MTGSKGFGRVASLLVCGLWLFSESADPARAEAYVPFAQRIMLQGKERNLFREGLESQLLSLVNAYRASHGRPRLTRNMEMQDAARAHAADMLSGQFLGHVASTGHDFDSRMRALKNGALVLPLMGENAARSKTVSGVEAAMAERLFQAWIKSSGHRQTLMSLDYLSVATGVASDGQSYYADQIFVGASVKTNMQRQVDEPAADGLY